MTEINSIDNWNELLVAAKNGNNIIQYEVAYLYDNGLKVNEDTLIEENKREAYKWYLQSHESGNINATIRLADFLSEGEFCTQNIDLAIELYKIAIDKGIIYALINLATVYRDKNDLIGAFEIYKTAQNKFKTNFIQLAFCYHFGIGTEQDKLKAFDIFLNIANDVSEFRTCEVEIEEANYYLGLYYLEGQVVQKSIKKARYFFQKANADNDHRSSNDILLLIGRSK